ncbi:MAG TPA: hypothetical protein ENJ60_03300 [Aeromonadales bacterium]|nr:hypothetical protein [Aeromonadales bacterium]
MAFLTRRKFLVSGTGLLLIAGGAGYYYTHKKVPLGFEPSAELLKNGRDFVNKNISVDIHAHPGRSFVSSSENLSLKLKVYAALGSFEEKTMDDMQEGGLTVASFSTVSDFQLLDLSDHGLKATREFEKGEAWQSYQHQMARLKSLLKDNRLNLIKTVEDIIETKKQGKLGALFTAEGGDFLESSLEHLDECYNDGIRSITLMHYHINDIGDIQTAPAKHHGLTAFGQQLVRSMNAKGMLIDLAHTARESFMKVMEITTQPVMVSHTAIRRKGFDSARFIDQDQATAVAEAGGIIGAWPAGIGLATFKDYVDQIFHLVDEVGIDHVALGTDMDANYQPRLDKYQMLPLLAGTLLSRGMHEAEVEKIFAGNFMRVFKEVTEG